MSEHFTNLSQRVEVIDPSLEIVVKPYDLTLVRFNEGNQHFVGIALDHYRQHKDLARHDIDELIAATGNFYTQTNGGKRAFVGEGATPSIPSECRPLDLLEGHTAGEMAMLAAVAKIKNNAIAVSGEIPDFTRPKLLLAQGFSRPRIALLPLMRETTAWDPQHGLTFRQHIEQRVSKRYATNYGWHDFDFGFDAMAGIYYQEFNRSFGPQEAAFCFDQTIRPVREPIPDHKLTPIQKLTLADNHNRDAYLPCVCADLWFKGYNILVAWGKGHHDAIIACHPLIKKISRAQKIHKARYGDRLLFDHRDFFEDHFGLTAKTSKKPIAHNWAL